MKRLDFRKLCYILAVLCFVSLFVKQSYDAVKKFTSGKTGYHVDLKVYKNLLWLSKAHKIQRSMKDFGVNPDLLC